MKFFLSSNYLCGLHFLQFAVMEVFKRERGGGRRKRKGKGRAGPAGGGVSL